MIDLSHKLETLVLPSLVQIYVSNPKKPVVPEACGTGFLVNIRKRAAIITAKHVLFGNTGTENPGEKSFHVDGKFVYVGDCDDGNILVGSTDVAVFYADKLSALPRFHLSNLSVVSGTSSLYTVVGYLARDFKRPSPHLSPAPRSFTQKALPVKNNRIYMSYPQRNNINTNTGQPIAAPPKPKGMSGGPILNTAELIKGNVEIVGVFTEQSDGEARGEISSLIRQAIEKI